MASSEKNLSEYSKENIGTAEHLKFGIIVSEWNEKITNSLLQACKETLQSLGAQESDITTVFVPGTYELPYGAKLLLQKNKVDAVIALGCVVRGETKHDDYINNAVSNGLMQLSLVANVPCIFGVVTTNDMKQAIDRSGGAHGNKGTESAITAVRMAQLDKTIETPGKSIGF